MAPLPSHIWFSTLLVLSVLSPTYYASASHELPVAHIYNHAIKRQFLGSIIAADSTTTSATASAVSATNTAAGTSATNSAANPTSAAASTSSSTTPQGQIDSLFSSLGTGVSSVFDPSSSAFSSHTSIGAAASSLSSSASRDRPSSPAAVVTSTSGGNVFTSTSFIAASTSSAAVASASSSNDQSDSEGIGIGKGTMIAIAIIASIVGAIAALWTIIRKWKLGPSRRFERKLESVNGDENSQPRPPSFAEKRNDYHPSTAPAHYRDPSLVNSDHSLSAAYPAMPPPLPYKYAEGLHDPNVHQHEGVQQPSFAVGAGLRRSNSGGSGRGAYGGSFQSYSPDPLGQQQTYNSSFPASAFDLHFNPSAPSSGPLTVPDPIFRAISPGAGSFRSPSPGRPAMGVGGAGVPMPMRMASPALAAPQLPPIGAEFDNHPQQFGYGSGYDHQVQGQPGLQRNPTVVTSIPYGGGRADQSYGGFEPLPPVARVSTPISFTAKAGTQGMPMPGKQHLG